MNKLLSSGVAVILLLPGAALAQPAITGTWKIDITTANFSKKPEVAALVHGIYSCTTCVPKLSVPADGAFHPVAGSPYYDAVAIKVLDAQTITETDQKAGKTVATVTTAVSADGKTMTIDGTDSSDSSSAPVAFKGTAKLLKPGPAGSHAISGSWLPVSYQSLSDNAVTTTYKLDGDMLSMSVPTGQSYTAKLGGPDAPYAGDPGVTTVSVKKLGPATIQETDKRGGKVVFISKMTIAPDGSTMKIIATDTLHGRTSSISAKKQ